MRNENLSLRWCSALLGKQEVNEFEIGTVENKTALIVTRFDRTADGGKIRPEDFAQILNKPRGVTSQASTMRAMKTSQPQLRSIPPALRST